MVQLVELFAVRHSVFIVGYAGTGKSMVWQCLHKTYQMLKQKPFYNDLDPKAVTNDELFGAIFIRCDIFNLSFNLYLNIF